MQNKINFNILFEAIKSDNLENFKTQITDEQSLKIAFGRFPLLSCLYLYKSEKIIQEYEKKLAKLKDFEIVDEPLELSFKFKKCAHKGLRLYLNKTIYPLEMLAFLDDRKMLKIKFNKLYCNQEIIQNIKKIYKINLESPVEVKVEKSEIIIPKKRLSKKAKLLIKRLICYSLALITLVGCSFLGYGVISGYGTQLFPLNVSNQAQFEKALTSGKVIQINKDFEITNSFNIEQSNCIIKGNNHTISIKNTVTTGLIKDFVGEISNIKFDVELPTNPLTEDYFVLTKFNSGKIDNVSINIKNTEFLETDSEIQKTLYLSTVSLVNWETGTLSNITLNCDIKLKNSGTTDIFFSGISHQNNGTIKSCKINGAITLDSIDGCAVASANLGNIKNCSNNANVSQTSEKPWNPNTSGICIENNGTIENSTNNGNISSSSSLVLEDPNQYITSQSSGISINNLGNILGCLNSGKISANGVSSTCLASGISSINSGKIENCSNTNDISTNGNFNCYSAGICYQNISNFSGFTLTQAQIKNCTSFANIFANSNNNASLCGGITCVNATNSTNVPSIISNCDFNGELTSNGHKEAGLAGICTFNSFGSIANCRSNITKKTLSSPTTSYFGGIAGFLADYFNETYNYKTIYQNYCTNNSYYTLNGEITGAYQQFVVGTLQSVLDTDFSVVAQNTIILFE